MKYKIGKSYKMKRQYELGLAFGSEIPKCRPIFFAKQADKPQKSNENVGFLVPTNTSGCRGGSSNPISTILVDKDHFVDPIDSQLTDHYRAGTGLKYCNTAHCK